MRLSTGNSTESSSLFAIYIALKCLQNIATTLVFILYIYIVALLWRKQVYHSNLVVLLMALPVSSLIAVVMTLVLDVLGALDLLVSPIVDIIEFAMKSGMFGGALNLPNFIVERLAATLLVDKYEKCNVSFPFLSSALILVQMGVVSFLIYLNTIGLISDLDGVLVFGIICAAAIVVRYQTAENMRAARLLNKLMVLYVCFFVAENLYYYVVMFVLHYEDDIVREILLSLFTILMVTEIFASVTLMAISHPSLRKSVQPKFLNVVTVQPVAVASISVENTKSSSHSVTDVRAVDGRKLLFTLEQEKEMYFKSYADMWNK
ncbi:unnamed protein product [Haemonchus placei]|uniref:G protein-coupled receptor n=1 Tax=Haemonchus placei TaxID=6290 RepID=A0A0N4XA31_HAEPC|nr:unnamed protein product [Haemonchus placei]